MITPPQGIKICGVTKPDALRAAISAGASYIGFVFYPPSPRNIGPALAAELAALGSKNIVRTGLFVDPKDKDIAEILSQVALDMIQLHGQETPKRLVQIRQQFSLPIIKAISIADATDIAKIPDYRAADMILCDAKPTRPQSLPGGTGLTFDWQLIANFKWQVPWMLAGGLNPQNIQAAIRLTRAERVDVSSGVERSAGVKDVDKIKRFCELAREEFDHAANNS